MTFPESYPYQIVSSDFYIMADSTDGPVTLLLPPTPQIGNRFFIKDADGTSGLNPITISGNGNTIDGQPDYTLQNNYAFVGVLFDGSEWKVINQ